MAGADEEVGVASHEVLGHANLDPVREEAIRVSLEGFDIAENVIPSSTVKPKRVIPEFIQDFVHLKHCWECFNQDCCPYASFLHPTPFLCSFKYIVPNPCFPVQSQKFQIKLCQMLKG